MEIIAKLLQIIADVFVGKEWKSLSSVLHFEHKKYIDSSEYQPSASAQMLLISGEDHRFFSHPGFDVVAICRAIHRRIFSGKVEGASTIEQQIVRVLTGRYERTIRRKVREILLAVLLKSVVPKVDLPGLYLQIAYYGWRMNNYRQACTRLSLDPRFMSLEEAARLVARLKYPEPRARSIRRQAQIERRASHLLNLHTMHVSTSVYKRPFGKVAHASI